MGDNNTLPELHNTTPGRARQRSQMGAQNLPLMPLPNTYVIAATSPNTRRAYQSDVHQFLGWGGLLPSTSDVIVRYLHSAADQLKPETLSRRLTAISQWHVLQGFLDPTQHPLVKKTLAGIKNIHGTPSKKAAALSLENLERITSLLQQRGRLADLRDRALLLIGYFGAFRRSELVGILYQQVTFSKEGIDILIPKSKTDQTGVGQTCAIPYGHQNLCPVTALSTWCDEARIDSGPIFRVIHRHRIILPKALTAQNVNLILKKTAFDASLKNPERYSGHSLRRGFATHASRQGASFPSIMKQGRWKSEATVLGYFEVGQQFTDNAANVLLKSKSKE